MMMMIMSCYCGMVDLRTAVFPGVVFPKGTIVSKTHLCDFLTSRDGNRFRVSKAAIRSASTTLLCIVFLYLFKLRL